MNFKTKSSVQLDTSLLPQYQEFRAYDSNLDVWNYLTMVGSYEMAAAFSKLFWPDFVEVDGCILLAEQFDPQNFKDWQEHFAGEREAIESMINHVHMYDLFLNDHQREKYSLELYEYLAQILTTYWKQTLKTTFPNKEFEFSYATEPDDYGPTISFCQKDSSG